MSDTATDSKTVKETKAPVGEKAKPARMTLLQVLVVLNMVLILLVAGVALNLIPKPTLRASMTPLEERPGELPSPAATESSTESREGKDPADAKAGRRVSSPRPGDSDWRDVVPWEQVERMFAAKDYDKAYAAYKALLHYAPKHTEGRLLNDYFQLRMGQCLARTDRNDPSREDLAPVVKSSSPVVRAAAWYELAQVDLAERRYLTARMKAYRALAALGAMDRSLAMEANCSFLIARALTEKFRGFQTSETIIHWPDDVSPDPFVDLDTAGICRLLREGSEDWTPSLEPSLTIQPSRQDAGRWSVRCWQMTVEELLNQFGAAAGKDVQWIDVRDRARRRSVDFLFRSVSSQKLAEVAAGMAGLIGRFTLDDIRLHDPGDAASVARQRDLISREAISTWRLFFLRHPTDPRIPIGWFALASVNELRGEKVDAVHEYELLARRFKRSDVAPQSLLRSAKIKIGMMNYAQARQDLIDLLDMYPDCPGVDKAYLLLAQVNETAGHLDEAIRSYEYLYHRDLSVESRKAASFGAGRCYSLQQKHAEATRWLARYAAIVKQPNPHGYAQAYFLMAREEARQGNYKMSVQAYHRGLAGRPAAETRIPALMELISVHIRQEDFISAVGVLNHLKRETLTKPQECRQAVLTAQVLRALGLTEKARSVLKLQLGVTDAPELRAEVGIELARCHMALDDHDSARQLLTEVLPLLRDDQLLWRAETLLAEVCLRMGDPDQAIRVAQKVRASLASDELHRKASRTLGEAYLVKREYEKAALALTGLKKSKPAKETK
ncbi:MAG: tetratricopeptide repeat protein [Phycisphaerae bacterium]|nr:tetratricopeptide repeat protein [Phycisphaerae bacterium]